MTEARRPTPSPGQRIAVVGSGIAGLASAYLLARNLLRLPPGALRQGWTWLDYAVRRVLRHYDEPGRMAPANALTIAVHLATCAAMGLLLLAGRPG